MSSIVIHLVTSLAYGSLSIWFWIMAANSQSGLRFSKACRLGLLVAIALHATALYTSILPNHSLYLGWALALSAAIWLGVLIYWVQSLFVRIDGLSLLLLPMACIVSLMASAFPQGHLVNHANNEFLRIHLVIAFCAYGITAIAAMHAIILTVFDRQLHKPIHGSSNKTVLNRMMNSLPPLLAQEQLLFQFIRVGFIVLTLTVITGVMASLRLSDQIMPFDHKTVFTLLSWVTFGVLLWGRHYKGWRGTLALKYTLLGFVFVVLAYTGSRFVLDIIL